MRYFPIFADVENKPVLVVGGNEDAARKVRLMLKTTASVRIVADTLTPELDGLVTHGAIEWAGISYSPAQLEQAALVYVAAEDLAVRVCADAQALNIPVNVIDRPELCTFITPALVDRAPVVVAIGTEGSAPVLAQLIKARIEALLHPSLGGLAAFASELRCSIEKKLPKGRQRRAFWRQFFSGPVRDAFYARNDEAVSVAVTSAIERNGAEQPGSVHFVGGASGDAELITLKAQRCLIEADIIIYEKESNWQILEYARRDAERLVVTGGAAGDKLVELARSGKTVVRLVSGAVSRKTNEAEALKAANVNFEIVPGVDIASVFPFPSSELRTAGSA